MDQNKKNGLIVLAVVVILVLAGLAWFYSGRDSEPSETVTMLDTGDELVTAPEGRVVSAFPEGFLLEEGAAVSASYAINYNDSGLAQPVVEYRSQMSLQENIDGYRARLEEGGWHIAHAASVEEEPTTHFHAVKGNSQANIIFSTQEEGVVIVSAALLLGAEE